MIPDFSAIVNRGEKIVLVGRNGVGKTTLLKALLADAPEPAGAPPEDRDAGTVRWGHEVSIGYFPQDHTGAIAEGHDAPSSGCTSSIRTRRARTSTACSARCSSAARKASSRPRRSRAARPRGCSSAGIMLQKPNVLVLDEPTNHLDLESINALNVALQKFEGTVLPRHARRGPDGGSRHARLAFRAGTAADFKGTYEEYKRR